MSNNIICIWFDTVRHINIKNENLVVGISMLNIHTGKTLFYQYETENTHNPNSYDLERFLSIHHPKEIVFLSI